MCKFFAVSLCTDNNRRLGEKIQYECPFVSWHVLHCHSQNGKYLCFYWQLDRKESQNICYSQNKPSGQDKPLQPHVLRSLADLSWVMGNFVRPHLQVCPSKVLAGSNFGILRLEGIEFLVCKYLNISMTLYASANLRRPQVLVLKLIDPPRGVALP